MEHPLIGELSGLSIDELQSKISELNKKLNWAMRTNNGGLVKQLRMAIESYNNIYQDKQRALFQQQAGNAAPDFSDKINIS